MTGSTDHSSFGPRLRSDGVEFRLWAPKAASVSVAIEGGATHPLTPQSDGWHSAVVPGIGIGADYRFVLPDGLLVPDPGSRFQPQDVGGPSRIVDPDAYRWKDGAWHNRPWHEAVVYELHVGTFTPEGTFRAIIGKLDALAALGVTAVQLMPVAEFPGARNWGYDGVLLYAPDARYGHPEDLKALVDAAHARGLMMLLDVVYNHFGPDGNYLAAYAPIFTARHKTAWGDGLNYDGADARPLRDYAIENALYWLHEFHFDGLRFDAVHAIVDDSPEHLLHEMARRIRASLPDRPVHLVLENEENSAALLARDAQGLPVHYSAQWNDDVHHVLHVAASGESAGYYAPYAGRTDLLGRALAEGFAFQGEMMAYRDAPRGESSTGLPPTAFVAFIQNHDHVGNRAFGDRLHNVVPPDAMRALVAVYLLLPQIPLLFMGEEWLASTPFPFFCDFNDELNGLVREGRRNEFAKFPEFSDESARERIPDPTLPATFDMAKLKWDEADQSEHAVMRAHYRDLLALRRAAIVPRLAAVAGHAGRYAVLGEGAVRVSWRMGDGATLTLFANLAATPIAAETSGHGTVIWQEGSSNADGLGAWSVLWLLDDKKDDARGRHAL